MRYLAGIEQRNAQLYIDHTVTVAMRATCGRSKCGSVIVKDDMIIGGGYDSPPADRVDQRRCHIAKDSYHKKVTDKTCCVHAEQRAIMDALKCNPEKILGSRLYFIRLDEHDQPSYAGKPYCTICSKMALDVGIAEFVLVHENGICVYDTEEYNTISYNFGENIEHKSNE